VGYGSTTQIVKQYTSHGFGVARTRAAALGGEHAAAEKDKVRYPTGPSSNMQREIVNQLTKALKNEPSVHAMWLEGSMAKSSNDELSDVDLWIDVDNGNDKKIYSLVEKVLSGFGEIDTNYNARLEHSELQHRIYHLKDTSEYHIYEIVVQSHSRKFVFTTGTHEIEVLFDKDNTVQWKDFNEAAVKKELESREKYLRQTLILGKPIIDKQLKRGKYIDAFGYYIKWSLEPLIELARIRHCPRKTDRWIKDIELDLPAKIVYQIQPLFKVSSLADISKNVRVALNLAKSFIDD